MNKENAIKTGEDTYSSAMESAHKYMSWMLDPFKPYLRGDIVEIGVGHGSYCSQLTKYGNYYGIDIDERSVTSAKKKYPNTLFKQADILDIDFLESILPNKADSIISINVLEHIEDDKVAVHNLVNSLKSGGYLLLNVPALSALCNDLDRLAGHHRRYSKNDFIRLLSDMPVTIEKLSYFNPIGGFGWWLNRYRKHESLNSDSVNRQIEIFEQYILPISRAIDPLTKSFFGQSVICIARHL